MMTLLQLEYFIALSNSLHFTKTAALLHISQPSLSYEMASLEKELGAPLFIVEKKKVSLSEYGRAFLPYAKKALLTLENGKTAVHEKLLDAEHAVRLGYFHSIGISLVPSVIDGFRLTFPEEKIRFILSELPAKDIPEKIRNGEIDLGFSLSAGGSLNPISLTRQPLSLYVPLGHPLAERPFVGISDLEGEPMIMLEAGSNLRTVVESCFEDEEIIPVIAFEVPECNAALQYVSLGFGVSILPSVPLSENIRAVSVPVRIFNKDLSRELYLISDQSGPLNASCAKVRSFIETQYSLKQIPPAF